MKTCRIPYENACRRESATSLLPIAALPVASSLVPAVDTTKLVTAHWSVWKKVWLKHILVIKTGINNVSSETDNNLRLDLNCSLSNNTVVYNLQPTLSSLLLFVVLLCDNPSQISTWSI